ncbi:MAG: flavodoxin family protein [Candidatus Nomurabacteria bacterium]|nr:MAG: flavodoxin family protein [Candidatus Nomurabacteria bacterium]HRV75775.1 flavodoxin family protein [Candidatus Saccharimonadales bacterium]
MSDEKAEFSGLRAIYFNCTLTKSPEHSHTQALIDVSRKILEKNGVKVEVIRSIDHDIAQGIYPDMTKKGWDKDEWPEIYKKVVEADILVLAGPIWLGDNSSEMKKIIERLYGNSAELNEKGQFKMYGKAGGCLITGNEDGLKHCAMNILYSLQHLGYTIPPQADAGWIGEVGPGASYGDKSEDGTKVGFDNDFTNRNTTFMSWNLMHIAKMLKSAGGMPAKGNQKTEWNKGNHFGFENPEYR